MSVNKLLATQQWKVLSSLPSSPDPGYIKLYYRSGSLYSLDASGIESQYSLPYTFVGGLNNSSNIVSVVLGSGLTFSSIFAGSAILVSGLTAGNFNSLNSPTDGYILSTTASGGAFSWIPFNAAGVSGTTNQLAKFNSSNSIGNSLLSDNGTQVYLGTTSTISSGASFSVAGKVNISDNLYFNDNPYKYIDASSGFIINTDNNGFAVNYNTNNFLTIGLFTASILNNFIQFGTSSQQYLYIPSVNSVVIGTSSATNRVKIYSSTPGVLQLVDGTQGPSKFLLSDSNGVGTWQNITLTNGLTSVGLTFGINVGNGLTVSSGYLIINPSIIGTGLTISTSGTISFATTSVTAGTYGTTQSIPQITVDQYGRITNITTVSNGGGGGGGVTNLVMTPSDKNWSALSVTNSIATASLSTVSNTPVLGSYVGVYINGQEIQVGNGTTSAPCFFGTNSTSPKGFSSSNSIQSGDYLYWNPSNAGYSLETTFRISLHYLTTS